MNSNFSNHAVAQMQLEAEVPAFPKYKQIVH